MPGQIKTYTREEDMRDPALLADVCAGVSWKDRQVEHGLTRSAQAGIIHRIRTADLAENDRTPEPGERGGNPNAPPECPDMIAAAYKSVAGSNRTTFSLHM